MKYFDEKFKDENIEPFVTLLSGGHGVGKAWVINMLENFAVYSGVGSTIKVPYVGIAANNIGGKTMNSAFYI
jgi:hypothetical protein